MSVSGAGGGMRPYLTAAAPLIVVALLAPLLELALRPIAGAESSAQIAAGVAAIPGALVTVRLVQRSQGMDAARVRSRPIMPTATVRPAGVTASTSTTTRWLLIVLAALLFMVVDLSCWLLGIGSFALTPDSYYATEGEFYNALSMRTVVLFFLGGVVVSTVVALRLRTRTVEALAIAVPIYIVGNTFQNVYLGTVADVANALYIAWTFAYVLAALLAVVVGAGIARRRQSAFDAARAGQAHFRP